MDNFLSYCNVIRGQHSRMKVDRCLLVNLLIMGFEKFANILDTPLIKTLHNDMGWN